MDIDQILEGLVEELSAMEHERWAHWQRYIHSKGRVNLDGSMVLPADLVARWERQISLSYTELTERERDSDREQVRKYLPVISRAIAARCSEG